MIHEMAAEDLPVDVATPGQQTSHSNDNMEMYSQLDLQWVDPSHGPIGNFETDLNHGTATGMYQANFDLGYACNEDLPPPRIGCIPYCTQRLYRSDREDQVLVSIVYLYTSNVFRSRSEDEPPMHDW
jgi:hypothetical protein